MHRFVNGARCSCCFTLLLLTLHGTCVRAQNSVDAARFFSLPADGTESTRAFVQKDFRAPWIESTEFRTETRDFDLGQQRYTLRLSPNSPGKAKAQTDLAKLQEQRPDFEANEASCDHLRERYEDWLDLYLITTELKLSTRLDTILADRRAVLERLSASLDFEWAELISLNRDRTDMALRRLELEERRRKILDDYGLTSATLNFSDFPSLEQLEFTEDPVATPRQNPETAYELELAAKELALEKAERKQYLDFVQAEYRGPTENPFSEKFSVGVGLQLPTGGNQKLKIRELELEQQQLIRKQEREREEARLRVDTKRRALGGELELYVKTKALFLAEAAELSRIAERLSRRAGFDPLPLLDIEERKLKNSFRLLDAKRDLLRSYLDLREDDVCQFRAGELLRK